MSLSEVRVIQVGCGAMGNGWMSIATKVAGLKVVGLVDMNRAAAEAMAQKHNLAPGVVFDTLKQAIAKTDPHAVFDVTVPSAHHVVTLEALKHKLHVMGEKPLSDTMPHARKMLAAARKARRLYAVIQNRRFNPRIAGLRDFLQAGGIGEVGEIHADFFLGAHFGGFRDLMDYPLIMDMAIHTFDQARFMTASDPKRVYCHSFNPRYSWYKGDAATVVLFELVGPKKKDIVFCYRGSWCAQGLHTSWESQWRIVGSKGTVTWDGEEVVKAQAVKEGSKPGFFSEMQDVEVAQRPMEFTGHEAQVREFVEYVRSGGKAAVPQTVCTDNIKSLAMVQSAVASAKSGRRLNVSW